MRTIRIKRCGGALRGSAKPAAAMSAPTHQWEPGAVAPANTSRPLTRLTAADATSEDRRKITSTLAKLLVHGRPVRAGALSGADPAALHAWRAVPIPLLSQQMGLSRLACRRGGMGQARIRDAGHPLHQMGVQEQGRLCTMFSSKEWAPILKRSATRTSVDSPLPTPSSISSGPEPTTDT